MDLFVRFCSITNSLSLSEEESLSKVASDLTLKKLLKVPPYILASREDRI
jgi:hypothetical protein